MGLQSFLQTASVQQIRSAPTLETVPEQILILGNMPALQIKTTRSEVGNTKSRGSLAGNSWQHHTLAFIQGGLRLAVRFIRRAVPLEAIIKARILTVTNVGDNFDSGIVTSARVYS